MCGRDGSFDRRHRLTLVGDVESHRQQSPGKARSGGERRLDQAQAPCRRDDIGTGFESVKRYLVPESAPPR
jgi:hypothetical protein